MTPEFAAFLGQFGLPITMLVVLGITGARGVWVFGREMKEALKERDIARKDRDEWKTIAMKGLDLGETLAKKKEDE